MEPQAPPATHEVTNQAPPLEHYNLYEIDPTLSAAVEREDAATAQLDHATLEVESILSRRPGEFPPSRPAIA